MAGANGIGLIETVASATSCGSSFSPPHNLSQPKYMYVMKALLHRSSRSHLGNTIIFIKPLTPDFHSLLINYIAHEPPNRSVICIISQLGRKKVQKCG
jgi:hypothetical protein